MQTVWKILSQGNQSVLLWDALQRDCSCWKGGKNEKSVYGFILWMFLKRLKKIFNDSKSEKLIITLGSYKYDEYIKIAVKYIQRRCGNIVATIRNLFGDYPKAFRNHKRIAKFQNEGQNIRKTEYHGCEWYCGFAVAQLERRG